MVGMELAVDKALLSPELAPFRVPCFTIPSKEDNRVARNMFCALGGIEGLDADVRNVGNESRFEVTIVFEMDFQVHF